MLYRLRWEAIWKWDDVEVQVAGQLISPDATSRWVATMGSKRTDSRKELIRRHIVLDIGVGIR